MATYNFNEVLGTKLLIIMPGAKLAGGSGGVLDSLEVGSSGSVINTDNFSSIGFYHEGIDEVTVGLLASYAGGTSDYIAPLIRTTPTTLGYRAILGGKSGTTYDRVTFSRDGSFLSTDLFSTPIDLANGAVTITLKYENTEVTAVFNQGGSHYETLTHTDVSPLPLGGSGAIIVRGSAASEGLDFIQDASVAPVLSYRGASAILNEGSTFFVKVASDTVTPTTGNTTAKYNDLAVAVDSVTFANGEYTITMSTQADMGMLYSATGHLADLVIDGNDIQSNAITFEPTTTLKYVQLASPSFADYSALNSWSGEQPVNGFQLVYDKLTTPTALEVDCASNGGITLLGDPLVTQTFNRYVRNSDGSRGATALFTVGIT